ncbi:two-component system sensor histidine kinase RppB [Spirulina subsalsa]|uniref:two-component system sensor histidine kinase RppB n=1 Tax=Spirulina subsalsa TaxID=54311 RepID=UPI00030EDD14|nr:two-component system sensor histidine kinase RppB [Spirulina subsalsa]
MNDNSAFLTTRKRWAGLYAATMGLILLVCGVSVYELIARDQWQSLNLKLATVAGTLHDGIEPALKEVGQVEPIVGYFLPGVVCVNGRVCPPESSGERHIAGVIQQEDYYVRFVDPGGRVLAIAGSIPENLRATMPPDHTPWQTLQDAQGERYREISLFLKTQNHQSWGYIQVGRSLSEYEAHLTRLRWQLMVILPTTMILVVGSSWWLSGLAMRPAYQAYRQIQQFTADAAHELRTPLAAIRSTVEFTLDEPKLSESDVRQTLRVIERQNNRLTHLVQDLLLLSRLDLNQTPARESCCLNVLMEDLLEEFSALAIAADLTLTAYYPSEILKMLGNEEQLYRLLANLLTNAIHYTPPGGMITVTLARSEQEAVITVQDTGIGIPLGEQSKIFGRFYRVAQDRARHTGGAGLGLAIAQAIAHSHQGSIQVQSHVDQGSLFTLRLPLKKGE